MDFLKIYLEIVVFGRMLWNMSRAVSEGGPIRSFLIVKLNNLLWEVSIKSKLLIQRSSKSF